MGGSIQSLLTLRIGVLPRSKTGRSCLLKTRIKTSGHYRVNRQIDRYPGGDPNGLCVHALRATAATNALSHEADIAKVQEWLGHANVSTTPLYDRRKSKPEDSPRSEERRVGKEGR